VEIITLDHVKPNDSDVRLAPPDLPAEVAAALEALYPGARVIEAEVGTDEVVPEVGLRADFNGQVIDVAFSVGGRVLEIQETIAADDLPAAALAWVRQNYPGATIDDATVVTKDGVRSYEMKFTPPGRAELEAAMYVRPGQASGGHNVGGAAVGRGDDTAISPAKAANAGSGSRNAADALLDAQAITDSGSKQSSEQAAVADASPREQTPGDEIIGQVDDGAADGVTDPGPQRDDQVVSDDAMPLLADSTQSLATVLQALGTGANAVAWFPRVAGLVGDALPVDLAVVERGLREVLREFDSLAGGSERGTSAGGVYVRLAAVTALVAAVQLILLDARKSLGGPVLVFNPAGAGWTWRRGGQRGGGRGTRS
jgi:hypothetical protein